MDPSGLELLCVANLFNPVVSKTVGSSLMTSDIVTAGDFNSGPQSYY